MNHAAPYTIRQRHLPSSASWAAGRELSPEGCSPACSAAERGVSVPMTRPQPPPGVTDQARAAYSLHQPIVSRRVCARACAAPLRGLVLAVHRYPGFRCAPAGAKFHLAPRIRHPFWDAAKPGSQERARRPHRNAPIESCVCTASLKPPHRRITACSSDSTMGWPGTSMCRSWWVWASSRSGQTRVCSPESRSTGWPAPSPGRAESTFVPTDFITTLPAPRCPAPRKPQAGPDRSWKPGWPTSSRRWARDFSLSVGRSHPRSRPVTCSNAPQV